MRRIERNLVAALLGMGCLFLGHVAQAQASTATATVAVSATVLSFCSLLATPLTFGNYSSAALSTTTTLTVTCTNGTTYNVGLDQGIGTGATVVARKMGYLTNTLSYGIYTDAAHTTVFGNTVGTNTVAGTATGLAQTITGYGQIPAAQTVAPGAYLDTVTATVTY